MMGTNREPPSESRKKIAGPIRGCHQKHGFEEAGKHAAVSDAGGGAA